jgi:nicotinate-nucleotide--dimethylbenzimidazole phosphoribosyltransferase
VTATLDAVVVRIPRPRDEAAREARRLLDAKTKPPGSLGRLEELACRLAAIRGEVPGASLLPAIVVAAADHGVAAEGVSPYPQVVTGQMLANFANGGAAVSVLAREAGARLVVVDAGVVVPPRAEDVRPVAMARGSGNIARGPAMSRSVAELLIERGIALAEELAAGGIGLVGVGDMGIANTTAASAVCAALLPADPSVVCGPGTGLDGPGVERKVEVVRAALRANDLGEGRGPSGPVDVLASVGGFEIAFLTGVMLGAASRRVPVLLDGFVTGAAALVAAGLAPDVTRSLIAATRSPEPGHRLVLERLSLDPLLDLGLRLGEGSGAALALPLVKAAVAILTDMATFDAAGVSRA